MTSADIHKHAENMQNSRSDLVMIDTGGMRMPVHNRWCFRRHHMLVALGSDVQSTVCGKSDLCGVSCLLRLWIISL